MKTLNLLALVLVTLLMAAPMALAQTPTGNITFSGAAIGAGLGTALTLVGAGYGFGKIGAAALEGMARQPEAAGNIQTGMIIIAALLEGATFFALIVCLLLRNSATF
jgi:F-type H+-transporting ATPase subunit c